MLKNDGLMIIYHLVGRLRMSSTMDKFLKLKTAYVSAEDSHAKTSCVHDIIDFINLLPDSSDVKVTAHNYVKTTFTSMDISVQKALLLNNSIALEERAQLFSTLSGSQQKKVFTELNQGDANKSDIASLLLNTVNDLSENKVTGAEAAVSVFSITSLAALIGLVATDLVRVGALVVGPLHLAIAVGHFMGTKLLNIGVLTKNIRDLDHQYKSRLKEDVSQSIDISQKIDTLIHNNLGKILGLNQFAQIKNGIDKEIAKIRSNRKDLSDEEVTREKTQIFLARLNKANNNVDKMKILEGIHISGDDFTKIKERLDREVQGDVDLGMLQSAKENLEAKRRDAVFDVGITIAAIVLVAFIPPPLWAPVLLPLAGVLALHSIGEVLQKIATEGINILGFQINIHHNPTVQKVMKNTGLMFSFPVNAYKFLRSRLTGSQSYDSKIDTAKDKINTAQSGPTAHQTSLAAPGVAISGLVDAFSTISNYFFHREQQKSLYDMSQNLVDSHQEKKVERNFGKSLRAIATNLTGFLLDNRSAQQASSSSHRQYEHCGCETPKGTEKPNEKAIQSSQDSMCGCENRAKTQHEDLKAATKIQELARNRNHRKPVVTNSGRRP